MSLTDIYRIKTRNSIYEIQVKDDGASRCRKLGTVVDEPWHTVKSDSSYLENLCVGPSFDVPGVVLTSMVQDYKHYVLSDEPKRTATKPAHLLQPVVDAVIAQVNGRPMA